MHSEPCFVAVTALDRRYLDDKLSARTIVEAAGEGYIEIVPETPLKPIRFERYLDGKWIDEGFRGTS